MSEASRARYLFLKNRLEELLARHGPPSEQLPEWLDHTDADPTWGPVGSLARQWMTELQVGALLALDRDMASRTRSTHRHAPPTDNNGLPATEQLPAQNRVLEASTALSRLDAYGETPLFGCPHCGEECAKASVPLDYWRCTACGSWGQASRLVATHVLPGRPAQRV